VLKGKMKVDLRVRLMAEMMVAEMVEMMAVHLAVLKVDWLDWLVEKMVG
jgi:hypothetical protein